MDKTDKEFEKLFNGKVPSHNFFRGLFLVSVVTMLFLASIGNLWGLFALLPATLAMFGIQYWWNRKRNG